MKYNSVPEYFVKLNNRLYALLLLPLLAFSGCYVYVNLSGTEPVLNDADLASLLLPVLLVMLLIQWMGSTFLFRKGLKNILTIGSLGERLDRYYSLTLLRFVMNTSGLFVLVVFFYLTRNQYFTLLFAGCAASVVLIWPTSAKVCNDLVLKGDERRLILYKLDRLS